MRRCPLCGTDPVVTGSRYTAFSARTFTYGDCAGCGLGLVLDPRQDYESIYDEAYYAGRGADPSVAYLAEMEDPNTIRNLEWDGLAGLLPTILTMPCSTSGADWVASCAHWSRRVARWWGTNVMVSRVVGCASTASRASMGCRTARRTTPCLPSTLSGTSSIQ